MSATVIIVLYVIPFIICIAQGRAKNRFGFGYALLGWIGVIWLLAMPTHHVDEHN